MMRNWQRNTFNIALLLLLFFQFGCVYNVPLTVNPNEDITALFPVSKKIHAKVGLYVSDDLRNYGYNQQKMGMLFRMEAGKYLVPISMQMASAMFDQAVEVNSLPPYWGQNRPDVEAVIKPEILYCYGNAEGTLAGQIEGKVKFRLMAYDLSGKVIWQGEAMGEAQSGQMDYVSTFLGNMDKVGQVGYQAGLVAAKRIVEEFNHSRPPELYSLLETKKLASQRNERRSSEVFDKLYSRGMNNYEHKNFQQALYNFSLAQQIDPDDVYAQFYVGVCSAYTGQKDQALKNLNSALARSGNNTKLTADCKMWIQSLREPLKLGIVFVENPSFGNFKILSNQNLAKQFADTGMYDAVIYNKDIPLKFLQNRDLRDRFLSEAAKKDVKIVICIDMKKNLKKLDLPPSDADNATEFKVTATVHAYGVHKKKLITEFTIVETTSIIKSPQTTDEHIFQYLVQRSADRLVLGLLENRIL